MAEPADGYMSNERPGLYPSGHHQMSKQACRKSFACIVWYIGTVLLRSLPSRPTICDGNTSTASRIVWHQPDSNRQAHTANS